MIIILDFILRLHHQLFIVSESWKHPNSKVTNYELFLGNVEFGMNLYRLIGLSMEATFQLYYSYALL